MNITKKPGARGRPSTYSPELGNEICRRLLEGTPLKIICKADDMPPESTVRLWVLDDVQGFAALYARARLVGYQTMADELLEISDNPETDAAAVQRDRLKVDTRKWLLAKALPKVYGDRLAAELTGKDGAPLQPAQDVRELARDVAFILAKGMQEAEQRD